MSHERLCVNMFCRMTKKNKKQTKRKQKNNVVYMLRLHLVNIT